MSRDARPGAAQPALSRLLTVPELAELLQVPTKTIYTWRYKGEGPAGVTVGRHLRFRAEDVAVWLDAQVGSSSARLGTRQRRSQVGGE